MVDALDAHLTQMPQGRRVFSRSTTTAKVNEALAQISTPKATTYSFRRSFIHRVLKACSYNGVVDYKEAMQYTAHE